jgi:tetratricopeptide (TPR) repeat protein
MTTRRTLQQALEALQTGRLEEAASLLKSALDRVPDHPKARWLLVQCLDRQRDAAGVQEQARLLLRHAAVKLDFINEVAAFLNARGHPLEPVLEAYRRHLEKSPDSANAAFNYGLYLGKDGQFEAAIDGYRQALERGIDAPEEVHLNIANLYMDHLGQDDRAKEHLERALAIRPDYCGAHFNLGNLAEQFGDREEAMRRFEKCLALDPGNQTALARLADTHRFEDVNDPLIARLEQAAVTSRDSDVHFALGRAWEQLAEYDRAWRHFTRANEVDRAMLPPYRPAEMEAWFRRIEIAFDREWLGQFAGASHQPVFICGMFRTGSTLLEQALAAHPAFTPGGESEFFPRLVARQLPSYPDGLDSVTSAQTAEWRQVHARQCAILCDGLGAEPGANPSRLTDKRPDNFLYLGLIKAVLPSARFIVTERDWRDVATSIYSNRLGVRQNYSTSLERIRHYIGLQKRLVDYWATLLGPDLVRVTYEALVARPEEVLRDLLERLGEEWDGRCLAFGGSGGTIKTASVWQVRQPLHTQSIGRWRHYQRPFEAAFGSDP